MKGCGKIRLAICGDKNIFMEKLLNFIKSKYNSLELSIDTFDCGEVIIIEHNRVVSECLQSSGHGYGLSNIERALKCIFYHLNKRGGINNTFAILIFAGTIYQKLFYFF